MIDAWTGCASAAGAVRKLLGDYARFIDSRQAVEFSLLFAVDGVFALGRREITGQAAVAEFTNAESGQLVAGHYRDEIVPGPARLVFARRDVAIRPSR